MTEASNNQHYTKHQSDQIQNLLENLENMIKYFEVAEQRLTNWRAQCEDLMQQNREDITEQVNAIQYSTANLQQLFQQAGINEVGSNLAQINLQQRENAMTIENISQEYLTEIHQSLSQLKETLEESSARWDRASNYLLSNASEVIDGFKPEEFRQISHESCMAVEHTAHRAIEKMRALVRWFHWKNIATVSIAALAATIITGLYLTDEYPWEIHKTVVSERIYGKALISVWPELNKTDQQRILKHINKDLA